jgi:GNAT superfamily N-acetyltransferase
MTVPEIVIEVFKGDQVVADSVAAYHLAVRLQQRRDGENQFRTNIHDSQTDLKAIHSYYIKPGGNFFIARDTVTNAIAGFVGIKRLDTTTGRIKRMAVLPHYRRQHIGTHLIETAITWASDTGFKKLVLATGEHENAIHIYKAAGFELVGYDEAHTDYLMEIEL